MRIVFKAIALSCFAAVFIIGCNFSSNIKSIPGITFVITGNTSPSSPFTGFTERLSQLIDKINRENPVLVIHTGNLIQGGNESMGIKDKDIKRQFKIFKSRFSKLNSILYTAAGEKDYYNSSTDFYTRNTGRNLNYSFNYGGIHFIIFNTVGEDFPAPSKKTMKWLKNDLERNRESSAIFVFTNQPVISHPRIKTSYREFDELHKLFSAYPVKAVISGNPVEYLETKKDNIFYIIAGCGGFTEEDKYRYCSQFFTLVIKNNEITISGKKI
ncbi:MAG: metallophosphoesterase [Spirochaetes bacterium]|jgi:hypothetical protein|nr:metallophosphoesterase [Spirochaetota bacterium]